MTPQPLPLNVARLSIWADPMLGQPSLQLPVAAGRTIASLMPPELAGECIVCRYQGQYVLRADWEHRLAPGDLVEFIVHPQGGNGGSNPLRTILAIVVIIAAYAYGGPLGAAASDAFGLGLSATQAAGLGTAIIAIGGNLAINALLPVAQASQSGSSPVASPNYNVNLSGNTARIDGAIPVLYGYNRTYPDFAGQPYVGYDNATSDQYYYALLVVGHGVYTIPRIEIDDTPLLTYADVTYNILPPGTAPSIVNEAVVTAPEVSGQELLPGVYIGPFAALAATYKANAIEVDVVLNGLGVVNSDGSVGSKSVEIHFEARLIDDFGVPLADWFNMGSETITASTVDAVRRTFAYAPTGAPARYLVRAARWTPKDAASNVLNTPLWAGLRSFLASSAPLDTMTTRIEIKMKANEQLNGLTQRKIAVTSLRKVHTWSSGGGYSTDPVETRNPAWILLDKWRSTVYGDGRPDSRIDLATLATLAALWDTRQDRCDIVIDQFSTSDDADQLIANCGRARVFTRNGVRTLSRDQAADVPVTTYSSRTIRDGTWSCAWGMATSISPDGYIIVYWSNLANDWREIECPAPGRTVTDTTDARYDSTLPMMSKPIRQQVLGITGPTQALREGLYMAAKLVYRRRTPTWSTEMQGMLPAYGSAVILAPALPTWAQSGDVVNWDAGSLRMGLSEPVDFSAGGAFSITLQRDDGSVHPAIVVTAGADAYTVVLASAPDFTMVLDAADRERPKYIVGPSSTHRTIVRVLGITPRGVDSEGAPLIEMTGVTEDSRVHTIDNAYLPTDSTVQDPISLTSVDGETGGSGGTGGGSTVLLTALSSRTITEPYPGTALARYELLANGQARQTTYPSGAFLIGSEWLLAAPTTTADSGLYEARVTVTAGALTTGTAGSWLALGTDRLWEVSNTAAGTTLSATMTVEIRAIATPGTILQTVTVGLVADALTDGGGGA